MSKSKFDIASVVGLMLLAGCDALRVPVPEDRGTQIRATLTGFVGAGIAPEIWISRPYDSPVEVGAGLPWLQVEASSLELAAIDSSGRLRTRVLEVQSLPGFRGLFQSGNWSPWKAWRAQGELRWNASAPYSMDAAGWVVDSFSVDAQESESPLFDRTAVRGSIGLRWPRLAISEAESLLVWARIPDSVQSLRDDWKQLCAGRGLDDDRVLMWDTTGIQKAWRWKNIDTSDVRRLMEGRAAAETIFAAGDSIWIPLAGRSLVSIRLQAPLVRPFLLHESRADRIGPTGLILPGSAPNGRVYPRDGSYSQMVYVLDPRSHPVSSNAPIRILLQITGTCPAFQEWRKYGSTSRFQKSTGNVAPFDGYLCEVHPDTMSFPEGGVELLPSRTLPILDTALKTKVVHP